MPVSSSSVAVGTARAELITSIVNKEYVYLQDGDYDGQTVVYVGGPDVTVGNGIKLSKINVTVFELYEYDELHAVASADGGSVRVLTVK